MVDQVRRYGFGCCVAKSDEISDSPQQSGSPLWLHSWQTRISYWFRLVFRRT
jgi:hypothetical protein